MINTLLKGVFSLIISLVNTLLSPIDTLITSSLPSLDAGLTAVNNVFNVVIDGTGYVMSLSGLSVVARDLVVAYWGFVLVLPLTFSSIKLAIKWYDKLKV